MESLDLNGKILNATKWSVITEIIAKLIVPITNMILARILSPEAFGVVATISLVTSFAEMFTDAGFQKYIVQHEFSDDQERKQNINVAFWTNLALSIIFWLIIILFSDRIAVLVGNPGLGNVLSIACIQIPISSFSSLQMALYKREFNFKSLFSARLAYIILPFLVTIPCALFGLGYWALIIGNIAGHVSNSIVLTIKSSWRPNLFYRFSILKEMLSYSIWTIIESTSIWMTSWIDILIVSTYLNQFYLGLYKTSMSTVSGILSLVTASTTPVLFTALSRLQNSEAEFKRVFLSMQRNVSILVLPMGVGIFCYRDLVTQILLGNKWTEAADIIGIWALTSSVTIVLSHYCSEVYRAKGKPILSFFAQVIHLVVLIPVCIVFVKKGFWDFVYARSLIRLQLVLANLIIMNVVIRMPITEVIRNISPMVLSSIVMGAFALVLKRMSNSLLYSFLSILLCIIVYFGLLILLPSTRNEILSYCLHWTKLIKRFYNQVKYIIRGDIK